MLYLLDTNVCIQYLNGRSNQVRERFNKTQLQQMAMCSIVKAELFYGARRSNHPERTLEKQQEFLNSFVSLPFDDKAAITYSKIRAHLAERGTPIGSNDLQIAAIALTHDLILVTHNTKEFSRVERLRLEDWEVD